MDHNSQTLSWFVEKSEPHEKTEEKEGKMAVGQREVNEKDDFNSFNPTRTRFEGAPLFKPHSIPHFQWRVVKRLVIANKRSSKAFEHMSFNKELTFLTHI